MFLEYGLAVASSTYCLTFFFTDHTMAQVRESGADLFFLDLDLRLILFTFLQNVVLLVNVFAGLILMVISFIMGLIQSTESTNNLLKVSSLFRLIKNNFLQN